VTGLRLDRWIMLELDMGSWRGADADGVLSGGEVGEGHYFRGVAGGFDQFPEASPRRRRRGAHGCGRTAKAGRRLLPTLRRWLPSSLPIWSNSAVTPSRSASLHGLCTDYLAHVDHATDQATQNPAFAQLIVAAGGAANVTAYCQSLLNGPSPTTTQQPSKADNHPTGSPHPTEHDPKGKPSQSTQ
jgi:hypothetical protein